MEWLKNNQIDEGIFTFSYIYDNFGNKVEKELVPGGKEIIVNEDNKKGISGSIQIILRSTAWPR
jgi:hypothetical protein